MPTEEFPFSPDVLAPLSEVPVLEGPVLSRGASRNPALIHYSSHSMDSAQCNDRPVSYTSTSSSASSSRDSHCSAMLGSAPERDRDSGAIRLELVPARQLEEAEPSSPGNQDEERKVAYVDHVVQEILETERTYVQDLQSIVQDYLECINNQARPLLGLEDRNSLFGNIREIYCFNRDFLHGLEKRNADPVAIAQCFVAKDPYVRTASIDFRSAFGSGFSTVVPQHLIGKLSPLGLNTSLRSWILDFLTKRPLR